MSEQTVNTEEKKGKRIIKHPFLDKHTIPGIIFLSVFSMIMVQAVLGGFIGIVLGVPAAMISREFSNNVVFMGVVVSSFIMLAIHKRWFYPEFEGNIKTRENLGRWLLIAVGMLAVIIAADLIISLLIHCKFRAPTVQTVLVSLVAGTSEEVAFRAVPGSYGMRQIKSSKALPMVVLLTSLIFSLVHATNILSGADVGATILQVVSSMVTGTLLCALYLRSGSILPSMLFHFLYDVYATMNANVTESAVMTGTSLANVIGDSVLSVIEITFIFILLRKPSPDKIMDLWKAKWKQK